MEVLFYTDEQILIHFENMKLVLPKSCDIHSIRRTYFYLPLLKHNFSEQLLRYKIRKSLLEMIMDRRIT